jgi:multidrug transporter EmrE-like cation transporter
MASNRILPNRNNLGFLLLSESLIAGLLLGLAAFFAKSSLQTGLSFSLILNPILWLAAAVGLAGFLLFQKSLHTGRLSIVAPVVGGVSIVIPVILAFFFLAESVPLVKSLGIALVITGVLGLEKN